MASDKEDSTAQLRGTGKSSKQFTSIKAQQAEADKGKQWVKSGCRQTGKRAGKLWFGKQ